MSQNLWWAIGGALNFGLIIALFFLFREERSKRHRAESRVRALEKEPPHQRTVSRHSGPITLRHDEQIVWKGLSQNIRIVPIDNGEQEVSVIDNENGWVLIAYPGANKEMLYRVALLVAPLSTEPIITEDS